MTSPRGLRVGLLFGGRSVEHEVSVISARGVALALEQAGLTSVPIGVTGEGRWLTPEVSREILSSGQARVEAPPGPHGLAEVVALGGGSCLLRVAADGPARTIEVDAVFPLVHGWGGEDGRLQGVLELASIPYVGSGVLGSAAAMDKAVAKALFEAAALPVARWLVFSRGEFEHEARHALARVEAELGLPVFVKPANGGSSVGVSRVGTRDDLPAAMEAAFECDAKLLVEAAIDAREIECAVLGNDAPEASILGEILPSREFYDYAAKYLDGTSRLVIPAVLDAESARLIQQLSLTAFRTLGLAGLARVDFLVDRRTGQPYVNEVNTLPGFTPVSMFPKLWEASGLSYPRLVERLVELAVARSQAEGRRRTRWQG